MPRFALLLLTACSISADYSKAHVRCTDGKCPSGLTCSASDVCTSGSAAGDASVDSAHDARQAARTCSDPGDPFANGSDSQEGSTGSATNEVSGSCGAAVYNGPDNVFAITGPRTVTISITGNYAVAAYVTATCTNLPPPSCEGGSAAPPSITVSIGAGMHYIIVDGVNAGLSGMYRLTVQ